MQLSPRAFVLLGALLHTFVGLKRTWDQKLFSGLTNGQLNLAISGLMLLMHMTVHLFPVPFRARSVVTSSRDKPDAVRVFSAQLLNVLFVPQHVGRLSEKSANHDLQRQSQHPGPAARKQRPPPEEPTRRTRCLERGSSWVAWPWTAGRSADSPLTSLPLHLRARLDVPDQGHLQIQRSR